MPLAPTGFCASAMSTHAVCIVAGTSRYDTGFDCNSPRIEKRLVQLDHDAILQKAEITVVKEIAPSFVDFLHAAVR